MDRSLVARIRHGDRAAFEEMVRKHHADLFDFALSLLRQPALAEDVLQDVLLNVWERRADWVPHVSIRAYLFASVRNRAYNALRGRGKLADLPPDTTGTASVHMADEQTIYRELLRDYLHAISELPERRREVYRLSRLYGLSYEEIAVVLGISTNTVRSQIASALKHLRKRLSEYLYALL